MAQAAVQLGTQALSCTLCLNLLKEPLPCGHNFCWNCVQSYCGGEEQRTCPQCRERVTPRLSLGTNSAVAQLVEQVKRTELQENPMVVRNFFLNSVGDASLEIRQRQQLFGIGPILCTIQAKETALQKLQQDVTHFRHCADEAVRHSDQNLSSLVRVLEFVHCEVSREIRALQEREEARMKQLHDQLQRDITELRTAVSELNILCPGHHCLPPSALDPPRTYSLPLGSLEQAASAVTALTDRLRVTLNDGLQNISQSFRLDEHPPPRPQAALTLPEPKTREEFINYAQEIILDPNTAHKALSLSRGNRGVTYSSICYGASNCAEPDHPDKFRDICQVLSEKGLTGRCYWEMEWGKQGVIAVSYKSIGRKGNSEESDFGYNDKSWALDCKKYSLSFWHHSVEAKVSRSVSNRIGVYVDHSAGVLAFYNIEENQTMSLLHRVQTRFSQPLYVGLKLQYQGDSVHFPKLKY